MAAATMGIDLREKGAPVNGQAQTLETRLFVQFLAFGGCGDLAQAAQALVASKIEGALYGDCSDPRGAGLVALSQNPNFFTGNLRDLLNQEPFRSWTIKTEYTMFGRTYSSGYEADLDDWLLQRPRRTIGNPEWPWAIWYPLRRSGTFAQLPPEEQAGILREHGAIGRAFGDADYSHDIRLASFGLDKWDNDFIIGLVGKDLFPLSATVQAMRRTKQTSQYMEKMGPFFIGRAVWQSPLTAASS
ncbi:MAG: chlorite dismutase family protein [Elusimicrobia bacterium]|nr:chlorite dismutase family protein [Elusimicrobiota bacterium]